MTNTSPASGCALVLLALAAGCGGGAGTPVDGGPPDGGAMPDTATITVTGARTASFSWDSDANYVSCLDDGTGFLSFSASSFAGGTENLSFSFYDYTGPGTYELTYSTGGGPSSTLSLAGGYSYWFFFNRASDLSVVNSTCTLVVAEDGGSATRIDATLTCSSFVARNISPDYDDVDPLGLRPSVAFTARFRCEP